MRFWGKTCVYFVSGKVYCLLKGILLSWMLWEWPSAPHSPGPPWRAMGILSPGLLELCLVCLWSCCLKAGGLATVLRARWCMNPPTASLMQMILPNIKSHYFARWDVWADKDNSSRLILLTKVVVCTVADEWFFIRAENNQWIHLLNSWIFFCLHFKQTCQLFA